MKFKHLLAEFIGTFGLVFIGAGAAAMGTGGLVGVALAHGLTLMVFAYAYGPISGTHINPAVTIGLWVGQQIETVKAVGYLVAQFLGGVVAGFVLSFILGAGETTLGATVLSDGVSPLQGFVLEAILTFFLVNTVYFTAVNGKGGNFAPLAIGMTLALSILMGGPLTGASLNPARTFGPAVASGNFADIWLYFAGPIAGGFLAALLYKYVLKSE